MELGYKSKTQNDIYFEVVKKIDENSFVVKLNKEKIESYKLVSLDDINSKKIYFEEQFLQGERFDSKKFNKNSSGPRP